MIAVGNNRKALKLYRADIPVIPPNGSAPLGRYYFPDLPNVANKLIVGIEAHIAPDDLPIDQAPGMQLNRTNRFLQIKDPSIYVTLCHNSGVELISQMPIILLFNKNLVNGFSKIIPFHLSIDPRKCFVEFPNQVTPVLIDTYLTITFTFYTR